MQPGGHTDPGVAGRSANREFMRRRERREAGGPRSRVLRAIANLSPDRKRMIAQERRWATGARGEELVARAIAQMPDSHRAP